MYVLYKYTFLLLRRIIQILYYTMAQIHFLYLHYCNLKKMQFEKISLVTS